MLSIGTRHREQLFWLAINGYRVLWVCYSKRNTTKWNLGSFISSPFVNTRCRPTSYHAKVFCRSPDDRLNLFWQLFIDWTWAKNYSHRQAVYRQMIVSILLSVACKHCTGPKYTQLFVWGILSSHHRWSLKVTVHAHNLPTDYSFILTFDPWSAKALRSRSSPRRRRSPRWRKLRRSSPLETSPPRTSTCRRIVSSGDIDEGGTDFAVLLRAAPDRHRQHPSPPSRSPSIVHPDRPTPIK